MGFHLKESRVALVSAKQKFRVASPLGVCPCANEHTDGLTDKLCWSTKAKLVSKPRNHTQTKNQYSIWTKLNPKPPEENVLCCLIIVKCECYFCYIFMLFLLIT